MSSHVYMRGVVKERTCEKNGETLRIRACLCYSVKKNAPAGANMADTGEIPIVLPTSHVSPLFLTREIIKRANGFLKGMRDGEIRIVVEGGKIRCVRRVQSYLIEDELNDA